MSTESGQGKDFSPQACTEQSFLDAEYYVGECITQATQMGANDSEVPELMKILGNIRLRIIEPDKAKAQAYQIIERKNPYH